jgi:hypothetical protein
LKEGDLCLLQPGDVHTIKGITDTNNPYIHLDFFYNPLRESSFVTYPGQLDMTPYASCMQPNLHDCEALRIPFILEPAHPNKMRDLVFKMIECWQLQTYVGIMEAHRARMDYPAVQTIHEAADELAFPATLLELDYFLLRVPHLGTNQRKRYG